MNPPGKLARAVWLPVLCLLAAAAPARPALERTLFKDIPPNEPVREVVATVLGSKRYSLKDRFSPREWSVEGYGAAWDRARSYFPDKAYLVRPGTYFMTHGFDADGRLFMEVHGSPYLDLCLENRRTFSPEAVVGEYGRMRAAANAREAAGFREKTGRLEASFRDEEAHRDLRKALGEPLYLRLLEALRQEDYHMLAGGLMHEGMHAGLDDVRVARLQAEFKAGTRPVQWDELRAFMAEIGYHQRFCGRAGAEIKTAWGSLAAILGELEAYRRTARLPAGPAARRFARIRARAWTQAAFARLGAREIWQSARRMQDLASGVRKNYVHEDVPPDVAARLVRLEDELSGFVNASAEAIRSNEVCLRALEQLLETWGAWAAGRRPFPAPATDSRAVVRSAADIRWAEPAKETAASLMTSASRELEAERSPS